MHETEVNGEEILINDLRERVRLNTERLNSKVNTNGESLSEFQLENLKTIVDSQTARLERMIEEHEVRRAKETSNT
jgi:hypothetical protein